MVWRGHETPGVILKYEQVTWNLPEGVLGVSPAGPCVAKTPAELSR